MSPELVQTGVALIAKDSAKFQSDMAKNQKAVSGMGKSSTAAAKGTDKFGGSLNQLASGNVLGGLTSLAGPIGLAAVAVVALGRALNSAIDASARTIGTVDDLADKFQLSAKEAGALVNVTRIFDVEIGVLNVAMRTLARQGIDPSTQGLLEVKQRLDETKTPAERAALTIKLLGRAGLELAEMFALSDDEFKKIIANSNRLALVTDEMTDAQDAYERKLRATQQAQANFNVVAMRSGLTTKESITLWIAEKQALFSAVAAFKDLTGGTQLYADTVEEATIAVEGATIAHSVGIQASQEQAVALATEAERWTAMAVAAGEVPHRFGEVAGAAIDAEETIDSAFKPLGSIWDRVFPDPAELAGKIAEQIQFIEDGGPQIVAAIQKVQAGLASGQLEPEEALPMLDDLQEAALAISVKAGDITSWEAAKKNAKDFGGPISQAKLDIIAAKDTIATIPRKITIQIIYKGYQPGVGFQHGGEFTVGGRSGPDANLVAFRATRGERVIVQPQSSSVVNNQRYDNRSVNAQFQGGFNPNDSFAVDRMMRGWFGSG